MLSFLAALFLPNRGRSTRPIPGPFTHEREARGLIRKTQSRDRLR
jgi:hypothetical protein